MQIIRSFVLLLTAFLIQTRGAQAQNEYFVYRDQLENGSPSGIMGTSNGNSLTIDPTCKEGPLKGESCLKISASGAEAWSGVFVQKGNNWKEALDASVSLADLTGKKYFVVSAKSTENYTIAKIGMGEGKEPSKGESKIQLTNQWQRFVFELPKGDYTRVNGLLLVVFEGAGTVFLDEVYFADESFVIESTDKVFKERSEPLDPTSFYVYADKFENGIPSGYMGEKDGKSISFNENWGDNPYLGTKCIKITVDKSETWRGLYILYTGSWNATLEDNSKLVDLSKYDKFEFYARAEGNGESEFVIPEVGIGAGDKYEDQRKEAFIELTPKWKKYTINLKGLDLKTVNSLFFMVMPVGTFYLDEMRFILKKEK